MDYQSFVRAADVAAEHLPHVFLLHGEEPHFIEKAEHLLLDKLLPDDAARTDSLIVLDGEGDPAVIEQEVNTVPFFGDRMVVIVRRSKIFGEKKAANSDAETEKIADKPKGKKASGQSDPLDRLLAALADMPETNYAIFELPYAADKRRKIFKAIEKTSLVLDAAPLRPWQAIPWFDEELRQRGLALDFAAREYISAALANLQEVPLGYLAAEAEKLSLYLAGGVRQTAQRAKKLQPVKKDDIIASFSRLPEISGFALGEAIDQRDAARALQLLNEELATGTYLPLIVAMIVRHVREYILVKAWLKKGQRGPSLHAALGRKGKYVPKFLDQLVRAANAHEDKKLKEIFLRLAEADYCLKTGKAGAELIEAAIIDLCRR